MAWTTPLTAVANTALTAAQFNASVRDNLLETAAAKATTAGYHFVATGPNTVAERAILEGVVDTAETTTSTSYTNLTTDGPSVSATTGTKALAFVNAQMDNSTSTGTVLASFEITGATVLGAGDSRAVINDIGTAGASVSCSRSILMTTLTPGSNTFHMQYRLSGAGTCRAAKRRIQVIAL